MSNRVRVAVLVVLFSIPSPGAGADDGPRDPATAGLLSGGITFAGGLVVAMAVDRDSAALGALGGTGLALGPSTGHWYAGEVVNPGLGVRVGGLAVAALGATMIHDGRGADGACDSTRCRVGTGLAVAGPVLVAGGTLYEILTAPGAARAHNRRRALGVTPAALDDGFGFTVAGNF
jgi:hypothetical protein